MVDSERSSGCLRSIRRVDAIVGAILGLSGVAEGGIRPNEAQTAGLGAGIGLLVTQFLAYLWGGYTAGRMARGSGLVNGILVAVVAIVLVAILGGILAAISGSAGGVNPPPPDPQTLPLPLGRLTDILTGIGIALLVTMFVGGALGGWLGAKWHTKLENAGVAGGR